MRPGVDRVGVSLLTTFFYLHIPRPRPHQYVSILTSMTLLVHQQTKKLIISGVLIRLYLSFFPVLPFSFS